MPTGPADIFWSLLATTNLTTHQQIQSVWTQNVPKEMLSNGLQIFVSVFQKHLFYLEN